MTDGAGAGPEGFAYVTPARRVVFAEGAAGAIGEEVGRLGVRRALLVTTPGRLEAAPHVRDALGDRLAGVFDGARLHVPSSVLQAALHEARRTSADGCVAFGGGSPIGLAKGIALETGVPIVAVPTTYSGSEMTSVWGITEEEGKRTGRDPRAAPRAVVYDPLLTSGFRGKTAAASGVNAVAHCVEALYAVDGNPVSALLAEGGIRLLADALPACAEEGRAGDGEGVRSSSAGALLGAHLAGAALDMTSMGLHHKLCHVLGGTFGLPHALVHAILLPYTAAYNATAAPAAMEAVRRALGEAASAPRALFEMDRRLGIDDTLRDLGLSPEDLDRAAGATAARSYPNPAAVTVEGVRGVLEAAWQGQPP